MKKIGIILAGTVLAVVSAQADHDRLQPEAEMQALAFELQDQTWELLNKARRMVHYRGYWEARAIDDLRLLKQESARLSRKLDRGYFDDYGVDRQMARVNKALHRAEFSMRRIHGKRVLHHKLRRAERTFYALKDARRELIACGVDRRRDGRFGVVIDRPRIGVRARVGDVDVVFERDRTRSRNTRIGVRVD